MEYRRFLRRFPPNNVECARLAHTFGVPRMSPFDLPAEDYRAIASALSEFRDLGGTEFVIEMVEILRRQTPEQFAEIDSALATGDLRIAQRHAHSMKSSFGSFGAQRCQAIAVAMDRAGKAGDIAAFRTAYSALPDEFDRLQKVLEDQAFANPPLVGVSS
ncbi:MAG: Hpt domain-containing protein [Gemmataceae bacterium]|nr:Hpt domain-containing protein [Gemmataceae bacterium]